VILSTHILSEAEAVADRIVVIAEGLVRAEGSVDEIRGQDGLERAFLRLVEATPAAEAPR
jgi:ABC-type multidrug transport system ATPase subunit